jgi:hypothetical protein
MLPSHDLHDDSLCRRLLSTFDTPAFIKRALRLEQEEQALLTQVANLRRELFLPVRLALYELWNSVTSPEALRNFFRDEFSYQQILNLPGLTPGLRLSHALRPSRPRVVRRRLHRLARACDELNRRWPLALAAFDLSGINKLVRDYNQYSLLERECAMSSARLAARGFVAKEPWTPERLALHFPALCSLSLLR